MSITLKVIQGKLAGKRYIFKEYTTCIVGRGKYCGIIVPNDKLISRHHCLLDINPPDIRVRDFGSRNGTYVNNQKIGQRDKNQTAREGTKLSLPEYELKNGDELKLSNTIFRVEIDTPIIQKIQPAQILKGLLAKAGTNELFIIPSYIILKQLGETVFLLQHTETGEKVVFKVIIPQIAANEYVTENVLREIENSKTLCHKNIVQLKHSGSSNGLFFFRLEYCELGNVEDLMKQHGGTLSVELACHIIRQALTGLEYAHNAIIPDIKLQDGTMIKGGGLIHRNLKPANIFLSGNSTFPIAKVGNFGLAKSFEIAGLSGQTRTGTIAGTPYFQSQQQVINFKYVKPEVDVWAMAASLYYMLTGAYPRIFHKEQDMWQTVLQSEPIPIRQRKNSIPPKLAQVIDDALVDKPMIQVKSATELKQALDRVMGLIQ